MSVLTAFTLVAVLGAGLLSGCGDEGQGEGTSGQHVSAAVLARANANCRQLRREIVELGRGAFDGATNLAEATTKRIVKPSLPLLERFARRQQLLADQSGDRKLVLYGRLFEPIIVLGQERLRAGERSSAPVNPAAGGFEILAASVLDEQRQIAREVGLADCAIDFEKVLRTALRS